MNENNASRGWVMDLVNSIANDLALANHLTETLHAKEVDLKNVEGDEAKAITEQISNIETILRRTTDLRRKKMSRLVETFDDYDPRMWCAIKHSIESYMQSMEVFHATNSKEDWVLFQESIDNMASVISVATGHEMQSCARCFSDQLMNRDGEGKDGQNGAVER